MNLAEAWEAGNGTASTNHHGVDIVVKVIDDDHVSIDLGKGKVIPKATIDIFGSWLKDLGIRPQEGWEPGGE